MVYISNTSQLEIIIPKRVREFLDTKAGNLGLATSVYIRYLIIKDIEDLDFPTFEANYNTKKNIIEGIDEYKKNKTKRFNNPQDLISSLQE